MDGLLTSLLNNPTLLYVLLLFGLWVAITGAHVPGTGVIEIAALVLIGMSLYVLTLLPTNWFAFMLLLGGAVCFFLLPYVSQRYAHLAEVGLVLQALGGVMLFPERGVSLPVIVVTVLVAGVYNRFVLMPLLRVPQGKTEYHEQTELIGAVGRVVKPLDPTGSVLIKGEIWSARSDQTLPRETEIIVLSRQGLELIVEKAKRDEG